MGCSVAFVGSERGTTSTFTSSTTFFLGAANTSPSDESSPSSSESESSSKPQAPPPPPFLATGFLTGAFSSFSALSWAVLGPDERLNSST